MPNNLPFSIADIAMLCGVNVPDTRGKNYVLVDCPLCGRKKSMSLKLDEDVFACHCSGGNGGMLDLYKKVNNCYEKSNGDIIREIKAKLNIDDGEKEFKKVKPLPKVKKLTKNEVLPQMQKADKAYHCLLKLLGLSQKHRKDLLKRGISEENIEKYMFRSVPVFGYEYFAKNVAEQCDIKGVAGFMQDSRSQSLSFIPKLTGIIIPVKNIFGLIEGLQIRLDKPIRKTRYIWLSSDGLVGGGKATTPAYFAESSKSTDTCIITEGAFKSIIPNQYKDLTVLGLAGVGNQRCLEYVLPELKRKGYTKIIEAFDADFRTNPDVLHHREKLEKTCIEAGFQYSRYVWDLKDGKGLDDFILNREKANRV